MSGMEYELIRTRRKSICAQIKDGRLIVRAPLHISESEIERFLLKHKDWIDKHLSRAEERQSVAAYTIKLTPEELRALMDEARIVIPARVAHYAPLVGVTYKSVTIRAQKSRWGSCSTNGNLSFNCLLLLAPPEVLDSIVVHELCHRKQMNHSPRFYKEVLRVYPDYFKYRKWLKENAYLLFAKLGK